MFLKVHSRFESRKVQVNSILSIYLNKAEFDFCASCWFVDDVYGSCPNCNNVQIDSLYELFITIDKSLESLFQLFEMS